MHAWMPATIKSRRAGRGLSAGRGVDHRRRSPGVGRCQRFLGGLLTVFAVGLAVTRSSTARRFGFWPRWAGSTGRVALVSGPGCHGQRAQWRPISGRRTGSGRGPVEGGTGRVCAAKAGSTVRSAGAAG